MQFLSTNTWLIPENVEKPSDARIKSGKHIKVKPTACTDA